MASQYNLCIIKPNKSAFSETFIQEHIDRLAGNKYVLYGGAFPVYDDQGKFLIRSKLGLLSYLIQKRIFKRQQISIRTHALKNYLIKKNIDAVFAEYGTVGSMVTEACTLANVPLVIHFHGADVFYKPNIKAFINLYKKAFKYAFAFIAVSADMVNELINLGAPADKIYNASCGVDPDSFPLVDISNSAPNFLAVGRFVEKKAPMTLVKSFNIVVKQLPDARLWMVGSGPLFNQTQRLIKELELENSITLTGILPSAGIKDLMKNMRCFVQHSVTAASGDSEGTPVTVLEAASSGLPVVSTRHGGIKEAVVEGVTGFLSDEHDEQAMAANMLKLAAYTDLAVKMGKAGRQHMITSYNIKDRIVLLDNIIQQSIYKK
jgi:colanic acid/amylovoran biosynthesis glycosyltransferase